MNLLEALELEERVGTFWHRLVGDRASWPHHPDAAVSLDEVRSALAVFFRGLGGDRGAQLTAVGAQVSGHRLTWRQRIGMDEERLAIARRDDVSLALPPSLAYFPDRGLNRDLYFWLAAYMAVAESLPPETDALRADLAALAAAERTTAQVLAAFPGLRARHARLCAALLAARPKRRLSPVEAQVEERVRGVLGGEVIIATSPPATAPRNYHRFLPVPLWGEVVALAPGSAPKPEPEEEDGSQSTQAADEKRRHGERRRQDNAERENSLILNRFEKVLAIAEMVNVNRAADDPDEEEAKKAADSLDTITLAQHARKAAAKFRFDLDLPPEAAERGEVLGKHLYPEWDYRSLQYLPRYCSVVTGPAPEEGESWQPDPAIHGKIRRIRRQFEALRTRPALLRGQADGQEIDTDAAVRARADLLACGQGSERVWTQRRTQERDLAVTVLVDASLSTDAWFENRRVLDVEKEALTVLCHGLAACGDAFSVLTFTSRKRAWVRVQTIKDFDEPFGGKVQQRIAAIRPGYYTRIGAAIRHTAARLRDRPNRHRLMLVLTDGKPNDVDHYEGRYGIEDSRKAILDARAQGIGVFGVTVDRKAQTYFPHLFGRGSFAIVHHLAHLSAALPRAYQQLIGVG